jgi:hypothetical protein
MEKDLMMRPNGWRITRAAGVKESLAGKTRRNNQSLRRGGALAASGACAG